MPSDWLRGQDEAKEKKEGMRPRSRLRWGGWEILENLRYLRCVVGPWLLVRIGFQSEVNWFQFHSGVTELLKYSTKQKKAMNARYNYCSLSLNGLALTLNFEKQPIHMYVFAGKLLNWKSNASLFNWHPIYVIMPAKLGVVHIPISTFHN